MANRSTSIQSVRNGSVPASNGFSDDDGKSVHNSELPSTKKPVGRPRKLTQSLITDLCNSEPPSVKKQMGRPRKVTQSLITDFKAMNGNVSSKNRTVVSEESVAYANDKNTNSNDTDISRPRSARRPKPNKVYADFIVGGQKHKSQSKTAEGIKGDSLNDENANNSEHDMSFNENSRNCSPLKSKALYNGKHTKRSLQINGENSIFCVTCNIYNCTLNHNKSPKLNTSIRLKTRSSDGQSKNISPVMINGDTSEVAKDEIIVPNSPDKSTFKESSPKSHSGRVQKHPALNGKMEVMTAGKTKTSPRKLSSQIHVSGNSIQPEPGKGNERSEASLTRVKATDSNGTDLLTKNGVEDKEENGSEYLVGDLLWSKIQGHPFWPCMVSYDPVEGIYKKTRTHFRDSKLCTVYHVQYFGNEAVHGWTMASMILRFEGLAKYESMVKDVEKKAEKLKTSLRKKMLAKYIVTPARRRVWEVAVHEAEDALAMTRAARKQTLTFEYCPDKKVLTDTLANLISKIPVKKALDKSSKRKRSLSPSSATKITKNKKLRTDANRLPLPPTSLIQSHAVEIPLPNKTASSPPKNKSKKSMEIVSVGTPHISKFDSENEEHMDPFSYFASQNFSAVRLEHPDLDEMGVTAKLRIRWQMMTDAQRESYDNLAKKDADEDQEIEVIDVKPIPTDQSGTGSSDGASVEQAVSETSSVEEIETSNTASRVERVCSICEKIGANINCSGPCMQSFHFDCLGILKATQLFKCDECTSGKPPCFSCKSNEGQVRRCTIISCGKSYHIECLRKYPLTTRLDGRLLTCPLHACLSCYIENPKHPRQSKSRLLKCIRCPTAFHMGDSCVSAGSVSVSQSHIICANHFERDPSRLYQSRLNVTWCFICSTGGSLICCDSCPAAFHAECLEIAPPAPEESFYCEDCTLGKHPRYRDIIWVKLGCYRWWPAEVCNLRNIPANILNMKHSVGEFPVRFFGSHDYYWIHRGRTFLFSEGDKGSRESMKNRSLAKRFQKALDEANEAFKEWTAAEKAKMDQENERCQKPPPFKQIKINKPVGNVQIHTVDPQSLNRCECDPKSENPCGSDTDCLNRMMMLECHPGTCRAGDRCENQRFQKRQYVLAVPYKSKGRGWGLKALEDIKKGQFVYEYVGDLIDEKECQRRLKKMHEENETNFYFLTIDNNRIIDAGPKGNYSRFMNHCCQPNCETQKWLVNGDTRVGLFAVQDIPAGTELTFNYNLDCRGNEKTKCACGAANCSGYIGVRPKAITNEDQDKKAKEAALKKKKKKAQLVPKHEDECFRCEEGGELVMCDRKGCPKSYHLNCLELAKPPHGRWECPWHHCDVCGRPSTFMCSLCPNSFCREHITDSNLFSTGAGLLICDEHAENELENCTPLLDTIKNENSSKD